MKRELKKALATLRRLIKANLQGEHYWFIANPVFVHIKNKLDKNVH